MLHYDMQTCIDIEESLQCCLCVDGDGLGVSEYCNRFATLQISH